ncbi:cation:proton antiporter [Sulfurimonas sp.]
MDNYTTLIFITLLIFTYALYSKTFDSSPITAPMVFVAMGALVGPLGLNLFNLDVKGEIIHLLTEITLILVLFVDASTINLKELLKDRKVPIRLLSIGLPLSAVVGSLVAYFMFPEISVWVLILMALILSPTDAALGQAVVQSKNVPKKIRQWISVESGLNDGIILPVIFAVLAVITADSIDAENKRWVVYLIQQITLGTIIGALVGWIGGTLISYYADKDTMNSTFQRLVAGSLAVLSFALAEIVHGNGFIAAFAGGLLFGYSVKSDEIRERIQEFGEAEGQQLILFVFLIFSMVMLPQAVEYWDIKALIYSLLSLTFIRMVPVAISLIGTKLDIKSILFIGWFGPRGIASVLYLLLVVNIIGIDGYEYILSIIILTVMLSIFLHGATAVSFSKSFKKDKIENEN